MAVGKVFLVGAGPGDAGLLTQKARHCLEQADAILYDRLASPRLLAFARPDVALYDVGKQAGKHALAQAEIEQLLISLAGRGLQVVRLKGGDPFVFGRGGEEAQVLQEAGIPFEIVPGITSAVSVPAYAGIPVTYRNVAPAFSVVTGHRCAEGAGINWSAYVQAGGTLVILMGVEQLPNIVDGLLQAGQAPDTPIALVRWGTRAAQASLIGTLRTIVEDVQRARFRSPAVIVVGEVVQLRAGLAWYEQLPLMGRRILITASTLDAAQALAARVEAMGAETFVLSTEQLVKTDATVMDNAIFSLTDPSPLGLYFRTALAVRQWFGRLQALRVDRRQLAQVKFAAATYAAAREMATHGIFADAIGVDVWRQSPGVSWWCEALEPEQEPPSMVIADGKSVRRFVPHRVATTSAWFEVAKEWLAAGVDAAIATDDADVLERAALSAWLVSLPMVRLAEDAATGDPTDSDIVARLRALWSSEDAAQVVASL